MCIHETLTLSQDGERAIFCPDCGREFGHLGRDKDETLVVAVTAEQPSVVVRTDDGRIGRAFTRTGTGGMAGSPAPTYPCRVCGWAMSCGEEGEDCHS